MQFFKFTTGHKAQATKNMRTELSYESSAICSLPGIGEVSRGQIASGLSVMGAVVAAIYTVKCAKG